jgi:preprotein translocase subunit YajC
MRIEDMTLDQLYEMNTIICERIDYLRAKKEQDAMQQLHLGSEVSFKTRNGETLFGVVIKINKKTVEVIVDGRHRYKIPPSLLNIVKDVGQKDDFLNATITYRGK